MHEQTMNELRLRHAQLEEKAGRLRNEQAVCSAASTRGLVLSREVRVWQKRADDYKRIIEMVELAESLESKD